MRRREAWGAENNRFDRTCLPVFSEISKNGESALDETSQREGSASQNGGLLIDISFEFQEARGTYKTDQQLFNEAVSMASFEKEVLPQPRPSCLKVLIH